MRRLLFALASTAAGLAAVLSFKTHSSAITSNVAAAAGAQSGMSNTSSGTPTGTGTTTGTGTAKGTGSAAGTGSAKGTATAKGTGSAARTGSATAAPKSSTTSGTGGAAAGPRTIVGTVDNTQYGPMQVEVVLQGRKITNVKVLQQTNVGGLSQQIDSNAVPQLISETLTAQSARINAVSGASYTSAGYIQSLQSALDKA
jgi:uncharacterized protein with FMN-binding domain